MSATPTRWSDLFTPESRVLLIVNSAPSQIEEIQRALVALERTAGHGALSVMAPSVLRPWLLQRGLDSAALLFPRLSGLEIEFDDFLQRGPAVRWALGRRPELVLGTEPYAPRNEEVKFDFERRVAPMLGCGRFVAHSLPDERVFLLPAAELWRRAARPDACDRHRARVHAGLDQLHQIWAGGSPDVAGASDRVAARLLAGASETPIEMATAAAQAYAYERLQEAATADNLPTPRSLRVVASPAGAWPAGGWLPHRIRAVKKADYVAPGLRWHGTRLIARGNLGGPYAYLLRSRPLAMAAGDAVLAEGRVFRGGVTIGLEGQDGQWACRADIDEPGRFLGAAVAPRKGTYALVVANLIKGEDHRAGLVLHRFGWAPALA